MDFKKFTSIENSYRIKEIQSIQINFPGEEFVVQEKIHGCLENRTKITMADGTTKTISEIVNNKIKDNVLGLDVNGKIVETPILNHFINGETENWLKIKFEKNGQDRGKSFGVIRCTPNHKFYIDGEYVKAETLKPGDYITHKRKKLHLSFIQKQVLIGKMMV